MITGANGFLGSHLCLAFLQRNAFVSALIKEDLKNSYLDLNLGNLIKPKIKIIKTDIVDFKAVKETFKKCDPDICLHLAAQPIVGVANQSPLGTFEVNIKGSWNILEAVRLYQTRALVVASSDKAYGEHNKLPYTEDSPLLALHPYDASKACADILVRGYAHTFGLNTAVTRCANIYGPGDLSFSRIIPDTMRSVLVGQDPVIRSDGTPVRDYIYIEDVISGYLALAKKLFENRIPPGEAFNFGTQKPIGVLSLVNRILKISHREDLRPKILSKAKIKGEIDRQYLSSAKAKKLLGWESRFSLDSGLRKTLAWYAGHLWREKP